ncbi:MAG: ATP-dependent DNA helicase RecG, partial [Pseudomonadota bacterium]
MSIRPAHLTPLFAPLTSLDGVGPKRARQFNQLLGRSQDQPARVLDLLFHLPTGVIDRRRIARLSSLVLPTIATTDIEVLRHQPAPPASRAPHRVVTETASGETLTLIFFRLDRRYVERLLPLGAQRLVSGRIDLFDGQAQMAHPDHILDPVKETLPPFELVYRKSADVTAGHIRSAVSGALQRLPDLTEWQRPDLQSKHAWPGFADAMRALHTPPETEDALAPGAPAWQRLAYDELLAGQLALGLMRHRLRIGRGKERSAPDDAVQAAAATLPFPLTGAQARCVTVLINDLRSADRLVRLLQGDVGCGKSAVAFMG